MPVAHMLRARKYTRHPAICRTQLDCGRRARPNQALVQPIHTDAANQLTTISRSGTFTLSGNLPATAASIAVNGAAAQTNGDFTFAKTGLTLADGNNTFTVSAQNLLGVTTNSTLTLNFPATVTYQYDLNGNLLTDGIRTFQWDAADQLAQVSVPNAWQTQFARDGLGRLRVLREFTWRNGAWSQTNETRYLYDGNLIIQERDANNNVLATYTRGLDLSGGLSGAGGIGGLLSRTAGANSYYYHSDGAGNITAMLDGNENVAARYLYDPFGRVLGQWGALAGANPMQFSSMPLAPASGLSLYPFRAYDPALQRWLSRDPLGEAGGINLYGFVGNSALNAVDPLGMDNFSVGSSENFNVAGGIQNAPPAISLSFRPVLAVIDHPAPTFIGPTGGNPFTPDGFKEVLWTGQYQLGIQQGGTDPLIVWIVGNGARLVVESLAAEVTGMGIARAAEYLAPAAVLESKVPQVLINKASGDGFRDFVASSLPGSKVEQYFEVSTGGPRTVDVLHGKKGIECKVGRTYLSADVRRELARDIKLLRAGRLDSVEWHFAPSPTTGLAGPSKPFEIILNKYNIPIVIY